MKRAALLIAVLMLGISTLAFGWGNATHVYLANRLGAKFGPVNLQEMYGALTPDVFNFMFDANGQILSNLTHFQPGLISAAAATAEERAIAYGFMTHNNVFGADLTAHGSPDFPNPLWPASKPGWVIKYGNLAGANLIAPLKVILTDAGVPEGYLDPLAAYLAPTMGHDLVETAVDILIKRYQDPLVGLRMAVAARARTPQTGNLLVKAFAPSLVAYTEGDPTIDDVTPGQAEALILGAEAMYQPAMEQYGQAFLLPEKMLIQALSEQSAVVAEQLIEAVLTSETGMTGWDVYGAAHAGIREYRQEHRAREECVCPGDRKDVRIRQQAACSSIRSRPPRSAPCSGRRTIPPPGRSARRSNSPRPSASGSSRTTPTPSTRPRRSAISWPPPDRSA